MDTQKGPLSSWHMHHECESHELCCNGILSHAFHVRSGALYPWRYRRCTFFWLNNTLRMWTLVSWMNVVCGCVLDLCPTLKAFWSFSLDAMVRAVWKMSAGAIHHWSKQKHLAILPPRRQYHAQPIQSVMSLSCRTSRLKNSMFSWCSYILRLVRAF